MKQMRVSQACACLVAMAGLLFPRAIFAAPPAAAPQSAPGVADVALDAGGSLNGHVISSQGQAMPDVPVSLWKDGRLVQTKATDAQGRFSMPRVHGGTYHLITGEDVTTCRVWTHGTAPPVAHSQAMVVAGDEIVRGNCCGPHRPLAHLLSNPWVIGGIIAAAVAIPVAIHNADDDDPVSPVN